MDFDANAANANDAAALSLVLAWFLDKMLQRTPSRKRKADEARASDLRTDETKRNKINKVLQNLVRTQQANLRTQQTNLALYHRTKRTAEFNLLNEISPTQADKDKWRTELLKHLAIQLPCTKRNVH